MRAKVPDLAPRSIYGDGAAARPAGEPAATPSLQSQFDADWARGASEAKGSTSKPVAPAATPAGFGRALLGAPYGIDAAQTIDAYFSTHPVSQAPMIFMAQEAGSPTPAPQPIPARALAQARHWADQGLVVVAARHRSGARVSLAEQARDVAAGLALAEKDPRRIDFNPASVVFLAQAPSDAQIFGLLLAHPEWLAAAGARPPKGAVFVNAVPGDLPAAGSPPLLLACDAASAAGCQSARDYAQKASALGIRAQFIGPEGASGASAANPQSPVESAAADSSLARRIDLFVSGLGL